MTLERWAELMGRFGIDLHADTYERLVAAYAERHRHYHTRRHIAACLHELDGNADLARAPHEVEIALWFHDAVYEPLGADNERLSADWATTFLGRAGVSADAQRRVYEHVIATTHDAPPSGGDTALVVDIDLAILGQTSAVYARFEAAVRREYEALPLHVYAHQRALLLEALLGRASIYCLRRFRDRYEVSARSNVTRSIQELRELSSSSGG
jgi:predicted metal-dependent HD superfamily phosphohydrolase